MIFNNCEFKNSMTSDLYKNQMNGFNDSTLKDYNPILVSSFYKKEVRDDRQNEEFIMSYLESAKLIMEETYKRQGSNQDIRKVFFSYSLVLPTIYLCRHCLELAIKRSISLLGKTPKLNHSLLGQWSALREYLREKEVTEQEKLLLNNMENFIKNIEDIDDNGMKLRYPKQKDNSDSQQNFLWMNTREIVNQTEAFVKQLDQLIL